MNKQEIAQTLADRTGLSVADCTRILTSFTDMVIDSLKKGEKVNITGLGSFGLFKRKERMAIHPQTKQKIKIPAQTVAKFRPGTDFRSAMRIYHSEAKKDQPPLQSPGSDDVQMRIS
jgi:DNA-binding protein HU-beta